MNRCYALIAIAILIVAGCSNPADEQRIRELEAQIANEEAEQAAEARRWAEEDMLREQEESDRRFRQSQQPPKEKTKGKKPKGKTVEELMELLAPTKRPGIGKTKAEIKTLFGPPWSSSSTGGLEEWVYRDGIFDPVTEKPVDLVLWIEKITEEVFYFTATYSGDKHYPAEFGTVSEDGEGSGGPGSNSAQPEVHPATRVWRDIKGNSFRGYATHRTRTEIVIINNRVEYRFLIRNFSTKDRSYIRGLPIGDLDEFHR
jgi:hypothetical protein